MTIVTDRPTGRLRRWREGKVRPLQGNAPHDRLVGRGYSFAQERLRRSLLRHSGAAVAKQHRSTLVAFSQAWGIYRPMAGHDGASPGRSGGFPPNRSDPRPRTRPQDRIPLIVQMSSSRLFLDRVARQQSPSPLHRLIAIVIEIRLEVHQVPANGNCVFSGLSHLTGAPQDLCPSVFICGSPRFPSSAGRESCVNRETDLLHCDHPS